MVVKLVVVVVVGGTTLHSFLVSRPKLVCELGVPGRVCGLGGLSSSALNPKPGLGLTQRVQSTNMVQSMVSVVVFFLGVWVSNPHIGT